MTSLDTGSAPAHADEHGSSRDRKRRHDDDGHTNGDKKHRSHKESSHSSSKGSESAKSRDRGDREKDVRESRDKEKSRHDDSRSRESKDRSRDDKHRGDDKEKHRESKSRDKERDRESSKSKDNERDKPRDREREKEREKEKDKDRAREKERRDTSSRTSERDADLSSHHRNKPPPPPPPPQHDGASHKEDVFDDHAGGSEISMSVSESNALRAKLGLPLLVEDEPSKEDTQKMQKQREDAEREAKTAELALKIEKMKNKRMLTAKLPGKTLAEEGAEEDALSWIKRTRKTEQERKVEQERVAISERDKALAAQRARMLDDFEEELDTEDPANAAYTSRHLAGMKVAHDAEAFSQDGEILILKDAPLIGKDDINSEDDELENVGLAEQERRKKNKEAAKKKPLYDVYGDDQSQAPPNILSQYDEEGKKEGLKITGDGTVDLAAKNQLEEVRKKLQAAQKQSYDLELTHESTLASDYYTKDEMAKFRRPATNKKKRMRKKEKPTIAPLEDAAAGGPSQDHGSRATRESKEDTEMAKDEERRRNYDKALERAEANSKVKFSTVADEEEDDLVRTLSRAKQGTGARTLPKLESVAAAVNSAQQRRQVKPELEKDAVVFSATAEFVRNLSIEQQQDQDDYENERKALVAKNPPPQPPKSTPAVVEQKVEAEERRDEKPQAMELDSTQVYVKKEEGELEDEEDEDGDEQEAGVVEDEPLVAGGMAATLKLLAQKGGARAVETFVGRTNDKRLSAVDGGKEVTLERLDAKGRPMTLKQAFREQSYKFHGKKPGKNKQEKRDKQFEEQKRMLMASSSDTPLLTLQAMQNAQAKAGTPYIILSSSSIARGGSSSASTAGHDDDAASSSSAARSKAPSSSAAAGSKRKK